MDDVARLVAVANAARARAEDANASGSADAEARLEAHFRVSHNFATYGTLAPGRPNHHVVAGIVGEWTDGIVEGALSPVGWGATLGYPAFRPQVGASVVPVHVLTSTQLPAAWPRLDAFEGGEYRRILVPVFAAGVEERRLLTVANLYAAA